MERIIRADWLGDRRARRVMDLIGGAGHRALFVGGCVRNALIGAAAGDVDVATDARPERVMALAAAVGLKAVPTGIEHGTVTLVVGGRPYEVTTFRRDVATDGRRAVVAFADDVAEDAARRDFTMNALYADAEGRVLDPVGEGIADLEARRVRFVGEPAQRIAEDYLRVLRFFRFHAWYGRGAPDAAALAACAAGASGLGRLSRERVGAETAKLLAAPDPAAAVEAMARAGVLDHVLPGARAERLAPVVAAEARIGAAPRWQRRLLALGEAGDWAGSLRLARADAKALAAAEAARRADAGPAALAYRFGAEAARDAVLLGAIDGAPPPEGLESALEEGAAARFPLGGRDLPELAGPALGEALRRLEAAWIASGFRLDRAALLALHREVE